MNRIIVIATSVLVMFVGQPLVVSGQTGPRTPQDAEYAAGGQVVEGKVSAVRGRWIVFQNGTQVAVPDNVAHQFEMKPGAVIRAMYEEREGQKFATSIELRDAAASNRQ